MQDPSDSWPDERNKNKKTNSRQVPSMNIVKRATKACRSALNAAPASLRLTPRAKQSIARLLDRSLESIAHVLCVHRDDVMVCGPSGASVAHLPDHQQPR
jgi:hypothetical protein